MQLLRPPQRGTRLRRERTAQRGGSADFLSLRIGKLRRRVEPEVPRGLAVKPEIVGHRDERESILRQDQRRELFRIDRIGTDDARRAGRARPFKHRLQKFVREPKLIIQRVYLPERRGGRREQHRAAAGIGREKTPLFVFCLRTMNGLFCERFGAFSHARLSFCRKNARNAAGGDKHCRVQHVIGARILAPVRSKEPPHFLRFLRRNGTVKCAEVEILSRSARNGGLLHMRRRGVHIPELLFRNVYPVERLRIAGAQNGFNGESRFFRALGGAAHERGFPVAGAALDVPEKRAVLRRGKRRIERNEPRAGICAEEKLPGIFLFHNDAHPFHVSGYAGNRKHDAKDT